MAEFPASAQTMVGNNIGACHLQLTGAAITVRFTQTNDTASWPYNCIRQFRADEDTKQFSFFSGRRGPYGVAEYKFDMTEKMLLALQDALTQFTGAQFGQGQNSIPGTGSWNLGGVTAGNGVGVLPPDSTRSPKRDPLPQIPGTPPSNQELHAGYSTHRAHFQQKHSASDVFATLPNPRSRQESLSYSVGRPLVPAPYDSQTMDSRRRSGAPSINTKYTYHEVVGNFSQPAGLSAGSAVATLSGMGRKMSHGDDVFSSRTMQSPIRNARLVRQATAPTHRTRNIFEETDSPTQSGVFSPPPSESAEDGSSDLDFGLLRRSSPQVDRKNTTRRGRVSPPESSPHHDVYSVPRPSGSTSSPPLIPPNTSADTLYQVPRPNSVDHLSQESAEIPASFAISPTQKDNVYSVPKPGSELYSAPRPQRQTSRDETPTTPDVGGSVIYNVPSSRPIQHQQQVHPQMVRPPESGQELYNTPRALASNGHDHQIHTLASTHQIPTNTPQTPQNGHELYNVPRLALESTREVEDEALYKVPRSLEAPPDLYSVPKPSQTRSSYDSLLEVRKSADYRANKAGSNPTSDTPVHQQNIIRQPIPTPEQETYSVPRPANPPSPVGGRRGDTANGRRYPYDYVDHRIPRGDNRGVLKPSRSLESLVRNRVTLSPDSTPSSQPHGRVQRTPSPRTLNHKYIEIDVDEFRETSPSSPSSTGKRGRFHLQPQPKQRQENVYAEISESESSARRRGSHLEGTSTQHVNGGPTYTADNNTPLPMQQGKVYPQQSNSNSLNVSKEARALHEEGYELVLPADEAARNLTLQQQKQATLPMNIHRTQSVSTSFSRNTHHLANGGHPHVGGDTSFSKFSTSGPQNTGTGTDEYVIVNRRDMNLPPTQPRDIPAPLLYDSGFSESQGLNAGTPSRILVEDEYEVMSSVKRGTGTRQPQFAMVPSVPTKKRGSVPSTNGTPTGARSINHSVRDSLDLDSIDSGSRASLGSGSHLDELVGSLSPIDAGVPPIPPPPYNGNGGPGRKSITRIASGSPHDISLSKELKFRSNSVENILDEDEKNRKYENVTDEDLAAKHTLSASHQQYLAGHHKKPPMPLPRPARLEH